jgi:CPA2 family monovalent cation:H+ antiporter-2
LVKLKVHPNAAFAGLKIRETGLGKKYSVIIVAIQRGESEIINPKHDFVIFPGDDLFVLATDDQIDLTRPLIEDGEKMNPTGLSGYDLRSYEVQGGSKLVGETLESSQIRSQYNAIVVGLERKGERFTALDPDFIIDPHDVLLIVGSRRDLDRLAEVFK